jgi:hypothetical protein
MHRTRGERPDLIHRLSLAGKPFGYHLAKRTSLQKRFGVLVYVAGRGA